MSFLHAQQSVLHAPLGATAYNDPINWTLIQMWDTAVGEMQTQDNAFAGNKWSDGINWKPDGTRMTALCAGQRTIRSFSVSTPFDPDSTIVQLSSRALGFEGIGGINLHTNAAGTQMWWYANFQNTTYIRLATDYAVASAGINQSDMTEAEWGYTTELGTMTPKDDFSYLIADGRSGPFEVRKATLTPAGNLDSFALSALSSFPSTVNGIIQASKLSLDETRYYRLSAGTCELLGMSTPGDPSTIALLVTRNLNILLGFQADGIWIDPNDTSEVWCFGDSAGETQMARVATNV